MRNILYISLIILSQQCAGEQTSTTSINLRNGAYASGDDYILPYIGSTINSKYYDIDSGDTVTVELSATHADSLQWTQIRIYQYDASYVATSSAQGSLWGAIGDSSDMYWTIVADSGAKHLTIEITKSGLSPDTSGIQTIHNFAVISGPTNMIPSGRVTKSFDQGGIDVTKEGQFVDKGDSLFIWAIYPDGSRDYADYASQGFNAVIGNYVSGNDLDSCESVGMYCMPNIAQYFIVGNALYGDTAHFRTRCEQVMGDVDSLILYWDNEQYSEYQNIMDIMAIKEELLPDVPVLTNFGNPGMLRLWREETDAVMSYGNKENVVPVFKIIDNMDDDSLVPPGAMAVISVWYDSLSPAELQEKVLRAVDAGCYGVALFKDGEPADDKGGDGDITTFRIWNSLPDLMEEVAEIVNDRSN